MEIRYEEMGVSHVADAMIIEVPHARHAGRATEATHTIEDGN